MDFIRRLLGQDVCNHTYVLKEQVWVKWTFFKRFTLKDSKICTLCNNSIIEAIK